MHYTFIVANGLVAGAYFAETMFCAAASIVLSVAALLFRRALIQLGLERRLWFTRVVAVCAAIMAVAALVPAFRLQQEYTYHFRGSVWLLGPSVVGGLILSIVSYVIVGREPKHDDGAAGPGQQAGT